ncbi:MAG: HlyD family efflux transporter periplasmic adaptor subunit [Deltaproteobacteria bacterium]|nr:HlyD family efflux transporter periplasmic adaptor subunit [Deltaproteobacteria bacterium]
MKSPLAGVVLMVLRPDAGTVAVGTPLIEIGDPRAMEVVVPVLTADAVDVRPGERVFVGTGPEAAGEGTLLGYVRVVEPKATTKISALGVEEQCVNVVVSLAEPPPATLGDGYTLPTRIVRWQGDVVRAPAGALFRKGDGWSVWIDDDGRAVERDTIIGHRAGTLVEVLAGLSVGDRVVLFPGSAVRQGTRLKPRETAN